jgi:hypothetical protein
MSDKVVFIHPFDIEGVIPETKEQYVAKYIIMQELTQELTQEFRIAKIFKDSLRIMTKC